MVGEESGKGLAVFLVVAGAGGLVWGVGGPGEDVALYQFSEWYWAAGVGGCFFGGFYGGEFCHVGDGFALGFHWRGGFDRRSLAAFAPFDMPAF